ncbi:MAG: 23S rRNA (pseudouridine(1915)-N(3))-methyltransferase RlmH [Saprospiraceae bacterium]
MKIELLVIGKTSFPYLKEGIEIYQKRLKHYVPFTLTVLPDVKNARKMRAEELKRKEGELILKKLSPTDQLYLFDERGKAFTSVKFSQFLERQMQSSHKRLVFVVGGAFGFSDAVYQRANGKITLSAMTFSHQMIRLFIVEQVYRAMTIMRGEPYHNE